LYFFNERETGERKTYTKENIFFMIITKLY